MIPLYSLAQHPSSLAPNMASPPTYTGIATLNDAIGLDFAAVSAEVLFDVSGASVVFDSTLSTSPSSAKFPPVTLYAIIGASFLVVLGVACLLMVLYRRRRVATRPVGVMSPKKQGQPEAVYEMPVFNATVTHNTWNDVIYDVADMEPRPALPPARGPRTRQVPLYEGIAALETNDGEEYLDVNV